MTYVGFEMVNAPFHDGSDFIKGNPFIRIPLDAGKHTEVHVFVSIGDTSLFGGTARFRAVVYLPCGFWDSPICHGQSGSFRGSARRISCPVCCLWVRQDSRKSRSCQKWNHQGRCQGGTPGGVKRNPRAPALR